jgi:hypothetical protein
VALRHAEEGQTLCAQVIEQQPRCGVAVVGFLLDHCARGDHQRGAALSRRHAVIKIAQSLIDNGRLTDVLQASTGLGHDGADAFNIQRLPTAIRLHDIDTLGRRLRFRGQRHAGIALLTSCFSIDDVVPSDLVLPAAHQLQLNLILNIFNVQRSA